MHLQRIFQTAHSPTDTVADVLLSELLSTYHHLWYPSISACLSLRCLSPASLRYNISQADFYLRVGPLQLWLSVSLTWCRDLIVLDIPESNSLLSRTNGILRRALNRVPSRPPTLFYRTLCHVYASEPSGHFLSVFFQVAFVSQFFRIQSPGCLRPVGSGQRESKFGNNKLEITSNVCSTVRAAIKQRSSQPSVISTLSN